MLLSVAVNGKLTDDLRAKIALFCDIEERAVIPNVDAKSIYEVPLSLARFGLDEIVLEKLNLQAGPADLSDWIELIESIQKVSGQVDIGIVGKYVSLPDSYLSVVEALRHAGFALGKDIEMHWIDAEAVGDREPRPLSPVRWDCGTGRIWGTWCGRED